KPAEAKPAGAICVQIDPLRDLFPMIEDRLSQTRGAETHLVRSEAGTIVYLTGARGTALIPAQAEPATAGAAFAAHSAPSGLVSGLISWVDERGNQVMAAIRPIESTPWAVVAKVERAELLERQRDLAIWSGAMVAAFVAVATAAAMLVARYQGLRLLRSARRRNARLSLRDRHFGMLARHANDIILLMDEQGAILEANERAESVYGYTRDELRGMHAIDLRADDHADFFDAQWAAVDAEEGAVFEARQKRRDGSSFPVELSVRTMEVEGVRYRQAIVRDLTERQQLSERLRFLARHDELTGLANRSSFVEALEAALARARRSNAEVAVMFVDLDDFKAVNDTAGHAAGDAVLQEFARRLESSLRATDFVARLGGDEFCVLMESSPERSNVELVARKILAAVAVEFRVEQGVFRLGASIGVSRFPDDGDQSGELLKCADSAMYDAKLAGKNAYRTYRRR
ncbi:MAG: diguanylate cyclase, partial [Burkholderiaceae bacterium]|nr:diguanylate cyclase [Burkholderiaceae bacterium]